MLLTNFNYDKILLDKNYKPTVNKKIKIESSKKQSLSLHAISTNRSNGLNRFEMLNNKDFWELALS